MLGTGNELKLKANGLDARGRIWTLTLLREKDGEISLKTKRSNGETFSIHGSRQKQRTSRKPSK